MKYTLNKGNKNGQKGSVKTALKRIAPLLKKEKLNLTIAFTAILLNAASNLAGPVLIAMTVDNFIQTKQFDGVLAYSLILLGIYAVGLVASYVQTIKMGGVGRRVLFSLRNVIFNKLQDLPVSFFDQNKTGDLISRINNDTDKLNQFFSQALMQFVGNFFLILGAGILLLNLNLSLGAAALVPAVCVLLLTRLISAWVKRSNLASLQSIGGLSAEIQESLENFKVIVAFNRQDYFRKKFEGANDDNFQASVKAGIASNVFIPIYGLASNCAQLIVLAYGIQLISSGNFTVGLLIGFLLYVNSFYFPLRQLAAVWSSFQLALAAMDRISEVLSLKPDLQVIDGKSEKTDAILEFKNVSFGYSDEKDGKKVLEQISLTLKKGHTYALVGPTGGGKTTTASLMARLYDPTEGQIFLDGLDLRSYQPEERTRKIGFILQEPFLFTGSVKENIIYGNEDLASASDEELREVIESQNLSNLLARFENGLETKIASNSDTISLGQKQLIAFIRAILRKPEILILDEASANIDTVTEQILEEILTKLPQQTTKVIIAHRLNTINNADQIFFVNGGKIVSAGSLQNAVDMLMKGHKKS